MYKCVSCVDTHVIICTVHVCILQASCTNALIKLTCVIILYYVYYISCTNASITPMCVILSYTVRTTFRVEFPVQVSGLCHVEVEFEGLCDRASPVDVLLRQAHQPG